MAEQGRLTGKLIFCTAVACLGNSLLYGYNIGVLNTPAPIVRQFYQDIYYDRGDNPLGMNTTSVNGTDDIPKRGMTDARLELLWSVTVAIFVAFGMIGAFMSGKIADVYGRRDGCKLVAFVMFVASIVGGLTKVALAPEMLIIHRALVGIHSGCSISLAPLYLAEISPKKIRGAIGTCHQLAITLGILLAQIFGLRELMGTKTLWPLLVGFQGIPCLISFILFFFCPESPRFLLLKKGDKDAAREALKTLRGTEDVDAEIEEMRLEDAQAKKQEKFSAKLLLTSPELRVPLIIAIVLQVAQQWSGINAVFYYSEFIFKGAGVAQSAIQYAIVGTGAINVITTIISVPLVDKVGRRRLLIWPMCVMAISMLVLTVSLNLQGSMSRMAETYVSIICMHTYVVGFALGLGPIPFIVVSELFRQAPRSTAMSIALVFQWMCNFILALCFRFLEKAAGPYTFVIFIVFLVASIIFIFFFVPETKNKSFEEIAHSFSLRRAHGKTQSVDLANREQVELMNSAETSG